MISSLSKNARESIYALVLKVCAGILSYTMFIVLARFLDDDSYGLFSFYFSLLMMISLFSSMGQGTFVIKQAEQLRVDAFSELSQVYRFSFNLWLVGGLFGAIAWFCYLFYTNAFTVSLYFSGLMFLLSYSASHITFGYLRVIDRAILAIATRDVLWRLFLVITFYFFSNMLSVENVLWVMSLLMTSIVLFHLYQKETEVKELNNSDVKIINKRAWYSASFGMALVAVVSSADGYVFSIFTKFNMDDFNVGIIFSSVKTIELIGIFLMAISMVMAKEYSSCIAKSDLILLQRKCNVTTVLQLPPVIFSFLLIVVFNEHILTFFSDSFSGYGNVLILMAIGMLINSITGSTVILMQLVGLHWLQVALQATAIIISLSILPLLVDVYGVEGVAWSYILSKLIWNIPAVYVLRSRFKIDPSIFGYLFNYRDCRSYVLTDLLSVKR